MRRHKIDLNTLEVEIAGGTAAGIKTFDLKIPNKFDTIIGFALFVEELPAGVEDFKVQLSADDIPYLPMTTRKVYESSSSIAPNDKFLTQLSIPCDTGRELTLKVRTSVAIPANTNLKFSIVSQVVNKKKFIEANARNKSAHEQTFVE